MKLHQTAAVAAFRCLGDQCPDTCCKGWGMQITSETLALYQAKAPELLAAVTSGEAEHIMRRDPVTDYCVKFENGWCGIHKDYGEDFLGDACHFYPRATRSLGEQVVTTLALSCPEAARWMLMEAEAFALTPHAAIRSPDSLKDYLPAGLDAEAALALHQTIVAAVDDATVTSERHLMRVSVLARGLELQPVAQWPAAAAFYLRTAQERLPQAQAEAADPYNLLHALAGLIIAAKATQRAALMQTVAHMEQAIGARLDWTTRGIHLDDAAAQRWLKLQHHWKTHQQAMQPILRRYLQAQLSLALFPFAGLGTSLSERITIIGVRFATLKLALMSEALRAGGVPIESDTIRAVYSLSRFLDHLADPALSLAMYQETGWTREPRLRALIGDA